MLALLDGGAQVSLITEKAVNQVHLNHRLIRGSYPAKSWAGDSLAFTGTIKLEFRIGPLTFKHTFYTCKTLATGTDMLLGLDWLQANSVTLQYSPNEVEFKVGEVIIPMCSAPEEDVAFQTAAIPQIKAKEEPVS